VLRCLAAAVLFGVSTPLASRLVGDLDTLLLAGLLYVGAGLAVLPSCIRRPPSAAALHRSWRPLAVAVIAGGALGPALLVGGLAHTSAATASLMLNFELVATAVLAAIFFREHLGARMIGAVGLVSLAGMSLAWAPGVGVNAGALLVAAACLCWGLDNNITARIDHVAPQHITLLKGLVAGTANLMLGIALSRAAWPSASTVVTALLIGGAGYGLSITLWVQGARDLGAARGQVIFATAPFIGAIVAWRMFDTSITATELIAAALAAAGVALAMRSAHEHPHSHLVTDHEHEHSHDDPHHAHEHPDEVEGHHSHPHVHAELVHSHPHVPDLHHRHDHH
jgi:drug/metabolite transporter (DMT)-like permease